MDYCAQPKLLPLHEALAAMRAAITPISDSESVTLSEALDRVLAEPIFSPINVPQYNNSAMDGYALRFADTSAHNTLTVIGSSLAGHPFLGELNKGECIRITTGALVPPSADTVIMQEHVEKFENTIKLTQEITHGDNIRNAGDDIKIHSNVFKQGRRITPIDIGLLASLGLTHIKVFKPLTVAVISTGDELKPQGQALSIGDIYDSNRITLMALLSRLHVKVIDIGLIADDPEKISTAFSSAIEKADAVISTGGVSVGDADYTKDVLDTLGNIHFWKIAIKPGKPFAFGSLKKNSGSATGWFFGLPGNPVSTVVTYHQLVVPALRYLAGETVIESPHVIATCDVNLKKQVGRADFQRGILRCIDNENENESENVVTSTGNQSSGVLSSLASANCYIFLEQKRGSVKKGEFVITIPFDKFIT